MDTQQCSQLIKQTLDPNNEIRKQAEATINNAKKNQPDQFLLTLCLLIKDASISGDIRLMALIILRRSVGCNKIVPTPWEKIQENTKQAIKAHVLDITKSNLPQPFRRQVVDLVGCLSTAVITIDSSWPEMTNLLGQWTQSNDVELKETSLKIFSYMLSAKVHLVSFHDSLSQVFINGLADPSANIRIASLEGSIQFLFVSPPFQSKFSNCIPNAFEIVTACLNNNQEDLAIKALELLIQLAELSPEVMLQYLDPVLDICLKIASQSSVDEVIRHSCLEIIISIGESKPSYLRQRIPFLQNFISFILTLMAQISDNPDWNKGEKFDEEDEEREIGNACLDRLALSVKSPVISILFSGTGIPSMITHADWRIRHTALISISLIGEGCCKAMEPILDQIINCILPCFSDPHERVRWAVCNTIGQMATDFNPKLQKKYNKEILESIISVMNDNANPRVQSYAAAAIINFCEECKPQYVTPYLQPLLVNLNILISLNNEIILEQCTTAIASVADCVGNAFQPYYNDFMPIMIKLAFGGGNIDTIKIRSKAIEGISHIAGAVGCEYFAPHSQEVINQLLQLDNSGLQEDDLRIGPIKRCWGKFAKALGRDFAPYLSTILPKILNAAGLEADVKLLSPEQQEDPNWQLLHIDKLNTIGINTSVVQEKTAAMNTLYWLAFELKETLYPYIKDIIPVCTTAFEFFYHDAVRSSSAAILPSLMRATKVHDNGDMNNTHALFHHLFPHYITGIENELYAEVTLVYLDALEECMVCAGANCMTDNELKAFGKQMEGLIDEFTNQRKLRVHEMQNEDEVEDARIELEKQHEIIIKVAELVGKVLEYNSVAFLPYIEKIYNFYQYLLTLNEFVEETQISVCFFDDLVEFGSLKSEPLYKSWIPTILSLLNHDDPDVLQAAIYGLGVLSEINPTLFNPIMGDTLNKLNQLINQNGSREDNLVHVTENAISSMGKIIQFHGSSLDLNNMIPTWFSYLPVTEDDETTVIYKQLCFFMMNHSTILLGSNFERLTPVIVMFTEIFGTELVEQDTNPVIAQILQTMQKQFPQEILNSSFQELNQAQKEKLQQILNLS